MATLNRIGQSVRAGTSGAPRNAAVIMSRGTNAAPKTTAEPGKNFLDFRTMTTDATGADSRQYYGRHYLGGAGAAGECGCFFTTVNAAGALGVHGIHASVSFGAGGALAGEAAGVRGTLHVPNRSLAATSAAGYFEVNCEGSSSDFGQLCALLRLTVSGDTTGIGKFDDKGYIFSIEGLTAGAAHAFRTGLTAATINAATTAALRIKVGNTDYFIPLATATA